MNPFEFKELFGKYISGELDDEKIIAKLKE
jgi:hypothetical protein